MSASSTAQRPRATRQRAAVADILARTDEFRSAQQIHAALEAEGTKVGLATVYRNLQTLAESGAVDQVRSAEGELLYRACEAYAGRERRYGGAVDKVLHEEPGETGDPQDDEQRR